MLQQTHEQTRASDARVRVEEAIVQAVRVELLAMMHRLNAMSVPACQRAALMYNVSLPAMLVHYLATRAEARRLEAAISSRPPDGTVTSRAAG